MYFPIGWRKVLKLDVGSEDQLNFTNKILQVQANHERELFFILKSKSIHIWYPRPAAEIVCHRRSKESIDEIGLNRYAIWKTDSSVIVVATDRDQLLFYQIKKRSSSTSATSFLLPTSFTGPDGIYRLKHDPKNNMKMLNGRTLPDTSSSDQIPALTMFSFGKLDLSLIGVSCLMAAEEELVIGARNGDIYGVYWDGNVDDKFPWSLSREVSARRDYLIDLRFSSVLSGFALVFTSGRVGFMPSRLNDFSANKDLSEEDEPNIKTNISYLASVDDAVCVEINHRHRLIAFGRKNSQIIVCNIGENNSNLVINHILELDSCKMPHDTSRLGSIQSMSYSPDSAAIAVSWCGGDFAIWSVFGSLLFCSQQWQLECDNSTPIKPMQIQSLAWGREGYNLWLCARMESADLEALSESSIANQMSLGLQIATDKSQSGDDSPVVASAPSSIDNDANQSFQERVLLMSMAHCNLTSSPHSTCSTDAIVLMSEEKIYVGPSVPHEDKFDHWIVIDVLQEYIRSEYPLRYATVDRECKNLAVSGTKGIALYSIKTGKWQCLSKKKTQQNSFSVCGDLIWWQNYVIASCFNFTNRTFEIRAYKICSYDDEEEFTKDSVVHPISLEIVRMSIFENRLLVLYVDGTLGMFMLNLRRKPTNLKSKRQVKMSSYGFNALGSSSAAVTQHHTDEVKPEITDSSGGVNKSDSTSGNDRPIKSSIHQKEFSTMLQISTIENLVISNLQANSYCVSSIALTRLHFKNTRLDDSILLNACGKLFLLEREVPMEQSNLIVSKGDIYPFTDHQKITHNDENSSSDSGFINGSSKTASLSDEVIKVNSPNTAVNSVHLASASLRATCAPNETSALSNVTFKAVSVIATNVEQFWISPEISSASEMSYFRRSLWLLCGDQRACNSQKSNNNIRQLQVWLPLLNDKHDPPNDLYVPDRIMLPVRCDIYPLAIRASSSTISTKTMPNQWEQSSNQTPDDAIVLGAESDVMYKDCKLFTHFPYSTIKRQCRIYLHRILRELLLSQHLGYYAKKIAEGCQSLPYFAHCFELLLHEVLEEEATSPVPLPDPMLPQVVKFIKQFPQVYLETVVHCARKSELSMWSHLFDDRAVGNPRRLFQECLEKQKLDTAASCLIILQSLDRNIVSSKMVKELIRSVRENKNFEHLLNDLESFLARAEFDMRNLNDSPTNKNH